MWEWKSQLNETGILAPKKRKETWRKIDPEKLRKYVDENPDAYQREMASSFGVRVYAIQNALKRLKITRKKTTLYKEINESSRQEFVEKLETIPPETLVYIDECGIDQYFYREFAYAPRGQKVFAKISGKKFKQSNIVAGICQGEWVAPLQYGRAADSVLFEFWFENCLLKEVKEGSTIILDNAAFHKKSVLPGLAEKYKRQLLFLPSYSPDLYPIENKWAWLKRTLRKILPDFQSFNEALSTCF